MELSEKFSEQTFVEAIKSGDFGFLTQKNIRVQDAKALIDKYYTPSLEEISEGALKEALENDLIKSDERDQRHFKRRVQEVFKDMVNKDTWEEKRTREQEAIFDDMMMVVNENRLSAQFYFILGEGQSDFSKRRGGRMLGWAENRNDKRSNNSAWHDSQNMFTGRYLTVDSNGRMQLLTIKPVLPRGMYLLMRVFCMKVITMLKFP